MELIFKISLRNLWRHRGHSVVIGAILFLGALIFTVGNGVVSGMDHGLENTVVHGFTGDAVIISDKQESGNVFLQMMGRAVEPIHNYRDVRAALENHPAVAGLLPAGKNLVMALNDGDRSPVSLYLLGVDFDQYRRVFPDNVNLIEGGWPAPGEAGLLLPSGGRDKIYAMGNLWTAPKGRIADTARMPAEMKAHPGEVPMDTSLVLMGFNEDNSATDIRLGVDGIFRYKALNTVFGNFVLTDIESYRKCLGYFLASEKNRTRISGADSALFAKGAMGTGDMDALFAAGDSLIVSDRAAPKPNGTQPFRNAAAPGEAPSPAASPARASNAAAEPTLSADREAGDYNLILVVFRPGADKARALGDINRTLASKGLGVHAVSWKESLGPLGSMAVIIKGALFVFVGILFLVAIIIIVNTLSMAAMERTSEIGMMRAIGMRKNLIGAMFLAETGLLSALFGGVGILAGACAVWALAMLKLTSANDMLQLFFGGDTFHPMLTTADFALAWFQLALVSALAVAYPLQLARAVTPLDAVYKE